MVDYACTYLTENWAISISIQVRVGRCRKESNLFLGNSLHLSLPNVCLLAIIEAFNLDSLSL